MTKFEQRDSLLAAYLAAPARVTYYPSFDPVSLTESGENEWAGIRALTYDGLSIDGRSTRVFAYIGVPKTAAAAAPVPAVVLVHGGGGHAFAEWIKIWNDRGYAAIAMDTTGFVPSSEGQGKAGHEQDDAALWHHGLWGELAEEGYTDLPDNDALAHSDAPLEKQWMLHAVTAVVGAHNVLRADERVDITRIGITGISWGGVITSIALGYDTRFAFAVPIYGSGYLDEAHSWMNPIFSEPHAKALWSAADRFDRWQLPVLWLCWGSDTAFSVNSNSRSYKAVKNSRLSIRQHWGHSHLRGWTPVDSYLFADSAVKGRPELSRLSECDRHGREVRAAFSPDALATGFSARLVYLEVPLSYSVKEEGGKATIDGVWQSVPAAVENDTVIGTVPAEAVGYYVELTTEATDGTYIVTGALEEDFA